MLCYAFDELTDKIPQFVNNVCLSYSILYLRCKFNSKITNDCQDFANLLQGYFNLGHPVETSPFDITGYHHHHHHHHHH